MQTEVKKCRAGFSYALLLTAMFGAATKIDINNVPDPVIAKPKPALAEVQHSEALPEEVPDFAAIRDLKQKKETFFNFLQPFIDAKNAEVQEQREVLLGIITALNSGTSPGIKEQYFIRELSRIYALPTDDVADKAYLQRLLWRVDVIPPSLVLAQAASESAWGTSRFAQDGYNFFGQWCFVRGCGFVPTSRRSTASHEVKSFGSIEEAVHAYFMNLNTFPSYQYMRVIRQQLRNKEKPIDGISLSEGLGNYSERGDAYIKDLRTMIYKNDLLNRDHNITPSL
ncbi:MAG: glucosaminidase domain-containing protein [Pseudomonadota bacterium]